MTSRKILMAIGLFLGFSDLVRADWNSFKRDVESNTPLTIDFSAHSNNPLTWSDSLLIGANHRFVGLKGSSFADMLGGAFQGFSLKNKTIHFYDNWKFQNFSADSGGAIYSTNSIVNFTSASLHFADNQAQFHGSAIFINGGFFDFQRSSVIFKDNISLDGGGALAISENLGTVNFTSSTVIFEGNRVQGFYGMGASLYLDIPGSSIVFSHSNISFTSNAALGYNTFASGLFLKGDLGAHFIDSAVSFSSNHMDSHNNSIGNGFISLWDGAKLNVVGGTFSFVGNTSADTYIGMNIASDSEAVFTNSNISFIDNYADNGGAAISIIAGGMSVSFTSSNIVFLRNSTKGTLSLGAAIRTSNSSISFTASIVDFTSNSAIEEGGAIHIRQSRMDFAKSTISFAYNKTRFRDGGVFYSHDNSRIDFTNSKIDFTGNIAGGTGGGVYAHMYTNVRFTSSAVDFTKNESDFGAGIGGYLSSNFEFIDSVVRFTSNSANRGGAVSVVFGSNLIFKNSSISFISNTAVDIGGAIHTFYQSSISLVSDNLQAGQTKRSDHKIIFIENKAAGLANDIYLYESQLWMSGGIWMEGGIVAENKSEINYFGRAWHLSGINDFYDMAAFDIGAGSSITVIKAAWSYKESPTLTLDASTFSFIKSSVAFVDNRSGAMRIVDSNLSFIGGSNVTFSSNSGLSDGGAVSGSNVLIFMEGDFEFSDNSVSGRGRGGAIFLEDSQVFLSAKNAPMKILFKDNQAADGADIYAINTSMIFDASNFPITLSNGVRFIGGGKLIKTGRSDLIFEGENSQLSTLQINEGRTIFKSSQTIIKDAHIEKSGTLSLVSGNFNKVLADFLILKGSLELDLDFSASVKSDEIIAPAGGVIVIENGASLNVNALNRNAWVYGSSTTIIFTDWDELYIDISRIFYNRKNYQLIKGRDSLSIIFIGNTWNFPKLPLTHNQNEAYVLIKKVSGLDINEQMQDIISDVLSKKDLSQKKRALDSLSGSFLAQTIVSVAAENPRDLLYDKTKFLGLRRLDPSIKLMSFWTDIGIKVSQIHDEENLLGKFESALAKGSAGFNFIKSADITAGAFASFAQTQIRQGENNAEVLSYEGGLYGGIFTEIFRHKYFAALGYHDIWTKRKVDVGMGYEPRAEFGIYSLKAGAETFLPLAIFHKTQTGLHGGINGLALYNDEIKENGGVVALMIEPGKYQRLDGYAGLKIGRNNWHILVQAGYLIYGNLQQARFTMFMGDFNHRMKIEGSNVDPLSFGLKFATDNKLRKNLYLQTLAGVLASKDLGTKYASLNVSVKYIFVTKKSAAVYQEIEQKEEDERLQKEIEERRRKQERETQRLLQERQRQKLLRQQEEEIQRLALAEENQKRLQEQETQRRLKEADTRRKKAKMSYKLKAASFESGRTVLSKQALENIDALVEQIKKEDFSMITVEGHTDSTGSKALNLSLSEQRARAVYIEMLKRGIPKEKIQIAFFGESLPVGDNKTPQGRALNRRVEIFVE